MTKELQPPQQGEVVQTELSVNKFIDGQRDCANGIPHKPGMGESYDSGYGFQYSLEQMHNEVMSCQ